MPTRGEMVRALRRAGCVAAEEEAEELMAAASDPEQCSEMLALRCAGEPLAWVTGSVVFGPVRIRVDRGVFVPRLQSMAMAERAAELLPAGGRAVDLFTGSGALAALLAFRRPTATIVGVDIDPAAVRCARSNGVDARLGDLDQPLAQAWAGTVDVLTAVAPYVPTPALRFLDRDSRDHEPLAALDGGPDGMAWLRRVVGAAPTWLGPGGVALLEVGADQAVALEPHLAAAGLRARRVGRDEDGDLRYLEAGWARS